MSVLFADFVRTTLADFEPKVMTIGLALRIGVSHSPYSLTLYIVEDLVHNVIYSLL